MVLRNIFNLLSSPKKYRADILSGWWRIRTAREVPYNWTLINRVLVELTPVMSEVGVFNMWKCVLKKFKLHEYPSATHDLCSEGSILCFHNCLVPHGMKHPSCPSYTLFSLMCGVKTLCVCSVVRNLGASLRILILSFVEIRVSWGLKDHFNKGCFSTTQFLLLWFILMSSGTSSWYYYLSVLNFEWILQYFIHVEWVNAVQFYITLYVVN